MKGLFDELKSKNSEKQAIYDKVNALNSELNDLETKKAKAEKKLHPKYNKLDQLNKGLQYFIFPLNFYIENWRSGCRSHLQTRSRKEP